MYFNISTMIKTFSTTLPMLQCPILGSLPGEHSLLAITSVCWGFWGNQFIGEASQKATHPNTSKSAAEFVQ